MDANTHAPTPLEAAASVPVPSADELAGRFPLTPNPSPADDATFAREMETLAFGQSFTDHMAHMRWTTADGWHDRGVIPFQDLQLSPAAAVLHYGQEVFEGLKAYRHDDGSVWLFRPGYNAARFNHSARRLAMPQLEDGDFVASLVDYIRADERWVPDAPGSSLYLRPFAFASEAFLGVHSAAQLDYYVIGSPSGAYFKGGFDGVSIWVSSGYHRSGPGGTGDAKCGGNYAASLLPQQEAAELGFQQVCFLDAREEKYLEELGGMNIFVVRADGSVSTPALTGTILEGGTRSAILTLLRDRGIAVSEDHIELATLLDELRNGTVSEVFACGTAAVVTPISRLGGEGFDIEIPVGEVTKSIHKQLTDIQLGHADDPYGWTYRVI